MSPVEPACAPQDHMEAVLLRHLRAPATGRAWSSAPRSPRSRAAPRACARCCATSGRARRASCTRATSSRPTARTARCGARSAFPMRGPDHLAEVVTALFRAPLWDVVGASRHGIYSVTRPDAGGLFLPAGRDDRWLYGVVLGPRGRARGGLRRADGCGADQARRGRARPRAGIERIGAFSFAAQIADDFRRGSAFLVGDAAHRVSPRGGTGMNSAPSTTASTSAGSSRGSCADGPSRRCSTPTNTNAGRSSSTTSRARPTRTARSGMSAASCTSTSGSGSPTSGCRRRQGRLHARPARTRAHALHGPQSAHWEDAATDLAQAPPLAVRRLDLAGARALGIASAVRCSPVPTARRRPGGRTPPIACRRCAPPSSRS